MNCKNPWNREFLDSVMTKTFMDNEFKKYRERVLFERELSLMPETMPYVEMIVKAREIQKEEVEVQNQISKLYLDLEKMRRISEIDKPLEEILNRENQRHEIRTKIAQLAEYVNYLTNQRNIFLGRNIVDTRKQFVRGCPAPECRGFLSSQWKCGLCSVWVCPDCHEIIGQDKNVEHTCHPDNIASAKLLEKDSKPCPKCASMIFKIEGCFAKDTPILMWDGTTKMSQDIKVGDKLIGDDGHPRIVSELVSGEDELYEVMQAKGMSYTVNSKHNLALKPSGEENNVIEMTIDDYNQLPSAYKKCLMGFKSNINLQTSITVTHVGRGKYYGWSVEGKNKRFLLQDFTVVRNCNQMFCTQCNTAFDWKSGQIVTNARIHNPHYFEYLRNRNGGDAPREVGDIPCGGMPGIDVVIAKLRSVYGNNEPPYRYDLVVRVCTHIEMVEIPYNTVNDIIDNRQLRISYILKELEEDEFKKILQRIEKANTKKRELALIYHMFCQTSADVVRRILQEHVTKEDIKNGFMELTEIRKYANDAIRNIARRYKCGVKTIPDNWTWPYMNNYV